MAQSQDMFPVIFESLKRDETCWICFFDCFYKKRQLANYNKSELVDFFSQKCKQLGFKQPKVDFFNVEERSLYNEKYKKYVPKNVFVQEINPKYPSWYPRVDKNRTRVVHFAWWDESKHLRNPLIDVDFSILKQSDDIKYGYENYNTKYFGNLRLDHLAYSQKSERRKRCFIPETYLRMSDKYKNSSMKIVEFCDELIVFLREQEFEIVWKKREKGYPIENWASPLDFCKEKPDIIIEKDLYFPSALMDYAYRSDICIVLNDCFAFFDMMHVNTNCCILTTAGGRKHKIDQFFLAEHQQDIIDMTVKDSWQALSKRLKKSNEYEYNLEIENNVSRKILNYCEG